MLKIARSSFYFLLIFGPGHYGQFVSLEYNKLFKFPKISCFLKIDKLSAYSACDVAEQHSRALIKSYSSWCGESMMGPSLIRCTGFQPRRKGWRLISFVGFLPVVFAHRDNYQYWFGHLGDWKNHRWTRIPVELYKYSFNSWGSIFTAGGTWEWQQKDFLRRLLV